MHEEEPCIFKIEPSKTKPGGFRLQKFVKDQHLDERKISETFRAADETPAAYEEALRKAIQRREEIENQKKTTPNGKTYIYFEEESAKRGKAREKRSRETLDRFSEVLEEDYHGDGKYLIYQLQDDETGRLNQTRTLKDFVESTFLPTIQKRNSTSDYNQKRAVWSTVKELSDNKPTFSLPELSINDIRPHHMRRLLRELENRRKKNGGRYSKQTIKKYFKIVRAMIGRFAQERGVRNPVEDGATNIRIDRVDGRQKTSKVVPDAELHALREGFETRIEEAKSNSQYRRYLPRRKVAYEMHKVLLRTGLRSSELFHLETEHFFPDENYLLVEGSVVDGEPGPTKRGKMKANAAEGIRKLPVHDKVVELIEHWLENRESFGFPPTSECSILYCTPDGDYFRGDSLRNHYRKAVEKADLGRNITPHMMRHTFNDKLRKEGVSEELRMEFVGHHSSEVNQNYTEIQPQEFRAELASISNLWSEAS